MTAFRSSSIRPVARVLSRVTCTVALAFLAADVASGQSPLAVDTGKGLWPAVSGRVSKSPSPGQSPSGCPGFVEASGSPVSVGLLPTSIALGDLDRDGHLDFATANYDADTVTIGLADGAGGFTTTSVPAGLGPVSVALGDLDQDGRLDFAVANLRPISTVTIGLADGAGGYVTSSVPVGSTPASVALGDMNQDGLLDFATADQGDDTVTIGLADGAGGYTTTSVPVGGSPTSVALADLNQDGRLDFATADQVDGTVTLGLADPMGGYTTSTAPAGGNAFSIVLCDLDQTAGLDYVVANASDDTVTVGLADGAGGYATSTVPVGRSPYSVVVGDLDLDGRLDFATADAGTDGITIGRGDGTGGFATSTFSLGAGPWSLALGDLNRDGPLDLAAALGNPGSAGAASFWWSTCSVASGVLANGRNPGSLLVYPVHRSGQPHGTSAWFTIVSVTNGNLDMSLGVGGRRGGDTSALFEYVNVVPDPADPFVPLSCSVVDRTEFLTPADTFSVLTSCHNAAGNQEGYLVVTATDPDKFKTPWVFNHLMGSECVLTDMGGFYVTNAIPFSALGASKAETDTNGNGQRDFDEAEYQGVPDELYIDGFVAALGSSLSLINLTGGVDYTATAQLDVWNDNEFPLSATVVFRCWFDEDLRDVSPVFGSSFLKNNTPHDPTQVDIDCDGIGDLETGWARITGVVASSSANSVADPAFLGSLTAVGGGLTGGHLLWESSGRQTNGSFLGFGL